MLRRSRETARIPRAGGAEDHPDQPATWSLSDVQPLDDPAPPTPGSDQRQAVALRVVCARRRRRLITISLAATVVIGTTIAGGVLADTSGRVTNE
jgi:hypothetical protein